MEMANALDTVFFIVWLVWLSVLAIIDVAEHRLPNGLTLLGYPFSLGWVIHAEPQSVQSALATAIACVVIAYGTHRFADLGCGDVKLAGSVGLLVGGSGEFVGGLALTSVIAGIQAAIYLIRTRNTNGYIPLGPALLAATVPAALVLL
jgi:leader peptidase (prepilin peptidase)/N-methyltransferase